MNKKLIIALSIIILLAIITIIITNPILTGRAIDLSEYTYTRAICDENNLCQDYEIICKQEKVVELNPTTGAVTQHPKNWQDPRNKTTTKDLCKK
jgi:hypothetical protein